MAKFKFYQDLKIVTWNRVDFEVEAETKEEAIEKMRELDLDMVDVCSIMDDSINVTNSDIIWDCQELMHTSQNDGYPTIEVYEYDAKCGYASDKLLMNNGE